MKRKCFIFLFLTFYLIGFAQNKKIDTANMLCSYVYEYLTDTLSGEQQRKEDLLYLQIWQSVQNAIAIILISVIL